MSDLSVINARVNALRARYADRDRRMADVQAIRRGNAADVAPDLFNDKWQRPIVANMIDTAARDSAAVLAPLPAFNCSAASGLSDRAKAFADKRTKIVRNYLEHSEFEHQMQRGADQYNSYGMLVVHVMPDFEHNMPRIQVEDAVGAYPIWDSRGRTVMMARVYYRDWYSLIADYPQDAYLRELKNTYPMGVGPNGKVEVIRYSDAERVVEYLPMMGDYTLVDMANSLGMCHYVCVQRPGLDDEIRGAYDDVVWVQLARHRIQTLLMEGIDKAVRAPLVVTPDVGDLPTGPDAVITAQQGVTSIGRARLDVPPQAFAAVEQLKSEQQIGAMSPEARSGNIDASVVTGRGIQQLMSGFSAQIAQAQISFKTAFRRTIELAFQMDEKFFGSIEKELRGNDNGVPYAIKYVPARDIKGDHTVDISYGFAAGLDPNRALVFLLQADGAGLVSKDYVRRNLPVDLNAVDEEKKIVVEQSRTALVQAFSALAQSIPQMIAAGQDVTGILANQAKFIELLQKGKTVEEAVAATLAPPPAQQGPGGPEGGQGPPGAGGSGGPPSGFGEGGLPAGLQANIATEGPGGRPDLQQFFAGLNSSGNPNLSAVVSRMNPVGT